MRPLRLALSSVLFSLAFFLMFGSEFSITGAFIGASAPGLSPLIGMFAAMVAGVVFASGIETKFKVKISIKEHPGLAKLAADSMRSERVQSEMDHLIYELSRGNTEAGLGGPGHVKGTGVFYLRGRRGARLFYRRGGGHSFEIVAKSDKAREDKVLPRLRALYKK